MDWILTYVTYLMLVNPTDHSTDLMLPHWNLRLRKTKMTNIRVGVSPKKTWWFFIAMISLSGGVPASDFTSHFFAPSFRFLTRILWTWSRDWRCRPKHWRLEGMGRSRALGPLSPGISMNNFQKIWSSKARWRHWGGPLYPFIPWYTRWSIFWVVVAHIFFRCSSRKLGKWSILTNIFQIWWNHPLENIWVLPKNDVGNAVSSEHFHFMTIIFQVSFNRTLFGGIKLDAKIYRNLEGFLSRKNRVWSLGWEYDDPCIWMFPKIGGNSQIIHLNRVFPLFINHPFLGVFPYFWFNTHISQSYPYTPPKKQPGD